MSLIRKEVLISFFVLTVFLVSSSTMSEGQAVDYPTATVPTQVSSLLDNVTIEMITNMVSHREDKIPSILPGDSFTVRFNITNYSEQQLRLLEMIPETNDHGLIVDNFTSSKTIFDPSESWITEEYSIDIIPSQAIIGNPIDVAIVLDISGSMQDEIDVLKADLIAVVEELEETVPDIRIGLVFFGGNYDIPLQNPYNNPTLVHDLTEDVQHIVDVLSVTEAAGGYEPWGDALWVSQHNLSWREDSVKLLTLITDEPCDTGEIVGVGTVEGPPNSLNSDYDGPLLYELFSNFSEEGFIICSIVASSSNDLTIEQLHSAAFMTGGTYIRLGEGDLQTDDLPDVIGELVEQYAVELDLKVKTVLSHLNDSDIREYMSETFTVLIDDLPPEIDFWVFTSENIFTDEKFLNIKCKVKDVTGVPYVEIYYRFDGNGFWIISNASEIAKNEYLLSVPYDVFTSGLAYQIYTKDWLDNEITTPIQNVQLSDIGDHTTLESGKRSEVTLIPDQSILMNIRGHQTEDSFLVVLAEHLDYTFDIVVLDLNVSTIIESESNCKSFAVAIPSRHVFKIQLLAAEYTGISVCNQRVEPLDFAVEAFRDLEYDDVILLEIDNRSGDDKSKSILADSQLVETKIFVFNASNWELLISGYSEVVLPDEKCYVLIYPVYHYGEIRISYNYEELNEPYDHYYAPQASSFIWSLVPFSIFALAYIFRKRQVRLQ
ncbi:MAG: vWA domain-containing protein [Candidatus Heimdallarchaeaceae archaeon]